MQNIKQYVDAHMAELYALLKNCDYIELDLEPLRKIVEE